VVVVVEPSVLPAGVNVDAGRKPTTAVDADVGANVAGWCGGEHTPSDTLEEHFQMGLHSVPLLAFLVGVDHIISDNSMDDELQKSSASAECKMLL
jgi:hypothetical protein